MEERLEVEGLSHLARRLHAEDRDVGILGIVHHLGEVGQDRPVHALGVDPQTGAEGEHRAAGVAVGQDGDAALLGRVTGRDRVGGPRDGACVVEVEERVVEQSEGELHP
ncbi:hypothetical protein [Microbacterium sp. SORGH_AS_0454]|uniref:hypothetical protein n=1 Tax=Microbacterium sp. SORGH_AS_0454 TaxID=3041758 RepID=UPI00286A52D2|nr:hypothetical protein [Microbacterium sp. SORGH_AS_0454]